LGVFLRICSERVYLPLQNHVSNIFPCKRFLKSCGSLNLALDDVFFTLGVAVVKARKGTLKMRFKLEIFK
jgi:hypothetical protein